MVGVVQVSVGAISSGGTLPFGDPIQQGREPAVILAYPAPSSLGWKTPKMSCVPVSFSMSYLRQFADADVAMLVVSAVSRAKDAKGRSSYSGEGLNLASFRESSEREFGCDDARC
jgi:hypothetical protein